MNPMSYALVDPSVAGVDPARLDVFLQPGAPGGRQGPLPSAQVAVARDGRLVAFETYGDGNGQTRATSSSRSAARSSPAPCGS